MPKRRRSRKGHPQDDRTASVAAAAGEQEQEAHARVVAQRSGDARWVQLVAPGEGRRVLVWGPGSPDGRRVLETVLRQRAAFRERFGREPGPDDSLVWAPDADTPAAAPDVGVLDRRLEALAGRAHAHGWDPAMVLAWRELGYVVTRANVHTFSARQVAAFEDAVRRHWARADAPGDVFTFDDLADDFAEAVVVIAARTVAARDPDVAGRVAASLVRFTGAEARRAARVMWDVAASRVTAAQEAAGATPGTVPGAAAWVSESLGTLQGRACGRAARAVGAVGAVAGSPSDDPGGELDEELLAGVLWLSAGLVATVGGGDAAWLRQFPARPGPDRG